MSRHIARGALVVGVSLALAGCAGGPQAGSTNGTTGGTADAGRAGGTSGSAQAIGPDATTPPPAPTPRADLPAVTVALAGDANTAWSAERALRVGVGPMSSVLKAADVAVLTLETTVVADRTGLVPEKKNFTFVTSPDFVDRLADAGVDVVNAANNHTMDYRVEGMRRMLALRMPVGVVGIGADADAAARPWSTTVRGRRVVVFGANDVETDGLDWSARTGRPGQAVIARPQGEQRLLHDVAAARAADPDAVIVTFLHWGVEPETCPSPRQRDLASRLAAAGADVVAGSHSHRQQPYTTVPGANGRTTAVAYGLGNFVFNAGSPGAADTGVLTVTVPGRGAPTARWSPARIVSGIPQPLEGAAGQAALDRWEGAPRRCSLPGA